MSRPGRRRVIVVSSLLALAGTSTACGESPERAGAGAAGTTARTPILSDLQGCYALELGDWIPAGADGAWPWPGEMPSPYVLPSRLVLAPAPGEGGLWMLPVAWEGPWEARRMAGAIEGDSLMLRTGGLMLGLHVSWDTLDGMARMWSPYRADGDPMPYRDARAIRIDCEGGAPLGTRPRVRGRRP